MLHRLLTARKMMLGEDGPDEVSASERHRTYESKPVWQRCLIVLAGPVANLLLAVVLYSCVNWYGVQEVQPVPRQAAALEA